MNKLLSVIIPSYNMEKYLPKCLGSLMVDDPSLLQQLDIIVVNDGSTDKTSEIAHEWGEKFSRVEMEKCREVRKIQTSKGEGTLTDYGIIRVIDKPNGHYGSCINAALPVAKGKYVRILDADDHVDTVGMNEYLSSIENVTVDVILAEFVSVNPADEIKGSQKMECLPPREVVSINQLKDLRFWALHVIAYNRKIFEGDWYRQLEGIQYTDCQWSTEPMLRVSTMYYVPQVVTRYLLGRDGQSMDQIVRLKCIKQQMRVDMRLAQVYRAGRADSVKDGAWDYFQRLYISELATIYALGIIGNNAGRYPRAFLKEFDRELKEVDPQGYAEVKEDKVSTVTYGRLFTFRYIKSYRDEPAIVFWLRFLMFKTYVRVRRFIAKHYHPIGRCG